MKWWMADVQSAVTSESSVLAVALCINDFLVCETVMKLWGLLWSGINCDFGYMLLKKKTVCKLQQALYGFGYVDTNLPSLTY